MDGMMNGVVRWIHVAAGIMWIGHLWFFNFVNGPVQAKIDAAAKRQVNPELLPRALYWFRWGAAWTWITGVLLVLYIFYHGAEAFQGAIRDFSGGAILMILVTFLAFAAYDPLANAIKDNYVMAAVGFVLTAIAIFGFLHVAHFGYRGVQIHTGAMFGTVMAANVWMRIWPAQRKIITATKEGTPPDAALVARAGARSRHNTYMSVPLVWTMISGHTTYFSRDPNASAFILLVVIAVGWAGVYWLYGKAARVPGF